MYDITFTTSRSLSLITLEGIFFFFLKIIYVNSFAEDKEHLASLLTGYILLKEYADLFLVIFIRKRRTVTASGTRCLQKGYAESLG